LARGLINSREDLFSPEFNQPRSHRRAFFPLLNERQTARTVKSLFRIIYLITIVPAAFSMLSYAEGNFLQLLLWAVAAVAWAGTALLTERQNEHMVWLLAAIFLAFIYLVHFTAFSIGQHDGSGNLRPLTFVVFLCDGIFVCVVAPNQKKLKTLL